MVKSKSTRKITKVNRPPLSKKAVAAINKYVELKSDYPTLPGVIDLALKADRMPREKLYSYLKYRGCRWKNGYWLRR